SGDFLHNVHELIDRDELAASQIEWIDVITLHNHLRALHAIVYPHKTARLFSIAPDFDFVAARKLCRNHFAADGRGRFFASAIVGSIRSVNIVIASYPGG